MSLTNPNSPAIAGDEYVAVRQNPQALSPAEMRGVVLPSTATESIDDVCLYLQPTALGAEGRVMIAVDIYDADQVLYIPGERIPTITPPGDNAIPVSSSDWQEQDAGVDNSGAINPYDASAYTFIQNQFLEGADISGSDDLSKLLWTPPDHNSTTLLVNGDAGGWIDIRDGSPVVTTGLRVNYVQISAVIFVAMFYPAKVWGAMRIGPTDFLDPVSGLVQPGSWNLINRFFYTNPNSGKPWANAHIDALTTTDSTIPWGLKIQPTVPASTTVSGTVLLASMWVRVGLTPERRLACGYRAVSGTVKGWRAIDLVDPDDGATVTPWSKANGDNYVALAYIPSGGGQCTMSAVDAQNVSDHEGDNYGDYRGAKVVTDSGLIGMPGANVTPGEGEDWVPSILFRDSGTASVDGQPYVYGLDYTIDSTHSVRQTIVSPATDSFQVASVLLRTTADQFGNALQDDELEVRIRRTSDNVVMAGPANVAPADVPPDGKYHLVTLLFSAPGALTSAASYYLELTTSSSVAWITRGALTHIVDDNIGPDIAADAAAISFQGTTGRGTYAGTADTTLDFPYSYGTMPTAPSGLSCGVAYVANRPALTGTASISQIAYATLDWTTTSLNALFGYYEVQRSDDGGSTWNTVAQITTEWRSYWNGRGGPRNTATYYRVRVVRLDGAFSEWTSCGPVTLTVETCVIVLASDAATDSGLLAYNDDGADGRVWHERQADQQAIRDVEGRDDPVAFFPSSTMTESFERTLIVAANDPAITSGAVTADRAVFDTILDFLHDRTLPHIEYCDGWGKVWLTSPVVPDPRRDEHGGRYTARTQFTQVASVPAVVVTDHPWNAAGS